MIDQTQQELLDELCPQLRPLIGGVMKCQHACQALDFFRGRPHAWLQVSDIAYHLDLPAATTEHVLNRLRELGILERITVLDQFMFYGLSHQEETLRFLDQYWSWRDVWRSQLEQVKSVLRLDPPGPTSGTDVLSSSL